MMEEGSAQIRSYFTEVYNAFLAAAQNKGVINRYYCIAGYQVQIQFAGDQLYPHITPALEHLAIEQTDISRCSIFVWDSITTNTQMVPFPLNESNINRITAMNSARVLNPTIYFSGNNIKGMYRPGTKTLSMFNAESNIALFWVPDAKQMGYNESSSPLRAIFQWWAKENGLQLVHAGAVGRATEGLLLIGTSGSGKSCTALSCLDSGYTCGGDDHMLLQLEPIPYAHSLYNVCRLKMGDITRFPYLKPAIIDTSHTGLNKALVFLNNHFPGKTATGFNIRAVVIPRVSDNVRTKLERVTPATALKALAPSTILQLPGAGRTDLQWMSKFIRQVPGYKLELGQDMENVPYILSSLLS